jgi:ubiquitin-protein ligase
MDVQRIRQEVAQATEKFVLVEPHPTSDGGIYVKAGLQTTAGKTYFLSIYFPDYPNRMPKVFITHPTLRPISHMYQEGHICFLHPNMWNPGRHDLTFVLGRVAKWLNKYDCWCVNGGHWPGAEVQH